LPYPFKKVQILLEKVFGPGDYFQKCFVNIVPGFKKVGTVTAEMFLEILTFYLHSLNFMGNSGKCWR